MLCYSFGKFWYSHNTKINDIKVSNTISLYVVNSIRASSMEMVKYVRNYRFMLLESVTFPQYAGCKELNVKDSMEWVNKLI